MGSRAWVGSLGPAVAAFALVLVVLGVAFVTPAPGSSSAPPPPSPLVTPASSYQWAFGGSTWSAFSCSIPACLGNLSNNSTTSVSWTYYAQWVALYTQTNVSSSQVEMSARAALNVTLAYRVSMCLNVSLSGPCVNSTISVSVAGREIATGSTNLTNGTVNLTAGPGAPGTAPAWAVENASSHEVFNFTGTYGLQSASTSGSATFDVGGWETSSVIFPSPLGVVPVSPVPGEAWTASAPFSASGRYVSGYSYTLSAPGTSLSRTNWTPGSVAPTGTLTVTGTDLGPVVLFDNYTNPPTTTTAQAILLVFSGANITAKDGWIFGGTDLYTSLLTSFNANASYDSSSSETAYYVDGPGFVGASLGSNGTNLSTVPGAPSFSIRAGPEPVSVAEQQYAAITANPAPAPFPLALLVAVVAIAAVAAGVGAVLWKRSKGRGPPPPAYAPAPGAPGEGASAPPAPGAPPAPPA